MSDSTQGTTRKEFFTKTAAAAAGAAAAVTFGFNRMADAQGDASTMITQLAELNLNVEKAEEGLKLLSDLCAAVEANEPGVLAYICHQSSDDPSKIVFFEVYKDEAALSAHGQTEHIAKLGAAFGTILMPPVKITKLDRVAGFSR